MAYYDPYKQWQEAARREQAKQQAYSQKVGYAYGTAANTSGQVAYYYNYATQEMKWVEPPVKREPTNLEWLDKRVNEMRVRL